MPLYSITHTTEYRYLYPVSVSHHAVYLQPLDLPYQSCRSFSLSTEPVFQDYRSRVDYFGNRLGLFSIQEEHQSLIITSKSTVEARGRAPTIDDFPITCAQALERMHSMEGVPLDVLQFLFKPGRIPADPSTEIRDYAHAFFLPEKPVLKACSDLMADLKTRFAFDPSATDIATPVEEFMQLRRGVCQDFAHFVITLLLTMGLPARYVSGYILTQPPPGKPRLEGADASHAWVSVYLPGHGWVDFDPTNNQFCSDEHVTVAYGRDFDDVSLVRGAVTGGGEHALKVAVTMRLG